MGTRLKRKIKLKAFKQKEKRMALLKADGTKRTLASYLSAVLELVRQVPFLAPLVPLIELLAGLLGGTGVIHAAASQTLAINIASTLAGIFAALAATARYVPALFPYAELFSSLATVLGSFVAGQKLAK